MPRRKVGTHTKSAHHRVGKGWGKPRTKAQHKSGTKTHAQHATHKQHHTAGDQHHAHPHRRGRASRGRPHRMRTHVPKLARAHAHRRKKK